MILYEVLTGYVPYDSKLNEDWNFKICVEEAVCKGGRPPYSFEAIRKRFQQEIPRKIYDILFSSWHNEPLKRPTFQVILVTLRNLISPKALETKEVIVRTRANVTSDFFQKNMNDIVANAMNSSSIGWKLIHFRATSQFVRETEKVSFPATSSCYLCSIADWKGTFMVKQIPFQTSKVEEQHLLENDFMSQTKLWEDLNMKGSHPNLVKTLGYYHDFSHVLLVMEYIEGGTLNSILWRRSATKEEFSFSEIVQLITQIIKGLEYLHQHLICYKVLNVNL